jgi:chromate reductase, NAD(P)H dehydrogenase (quinone)
MPRGPMDRARGRESRQGIIGVSVGMFGMLLAQQHLRNILACLEVPTFDQPEAFIHAKAELFDTDGGIAPASRQLCGLDQAVCGTVTRAAPTAC